MIILDAKYKRHAEQIERLGWHGVGERTREQHRHDLLQVLAYSTLFDAPRLASVLVYPCSVDRWKRLHERDRVLMRARVRGGGRQVELALLAVPLGAEIEDAVPYLERMLLTTVDGDPRAPMEGAEWL